MPEQLLFCFEVITSCQQLIHGDDSDDYELYLLASSNLLAVEECFILMYIAEVLSELHLPLRKLVAVRVTNVIKSLQSALTFWLKLCEVGKNSHYIFFEIFLCPDTTRVLKSHLYCDVTRNLWLPVN